MINNNNGEDVFFDYVDNGVVKKAEVLTLFNVDGSNKTYALCSIPTDNDNYDITAFILNNIDPSTVSLDDIIDQDELSKVNVAVNAIING